MTKLTVLLLVLTITQGFAKGYGQRINLDEKDVPLTSVFKAIEQQSGYTFFYEPQRMSALKVTVKVKDASLPKALEEVMRGLALSYKVIRTTVVITEKERLQVLVPESAIMVEELPAAVPVTGVVLTATGEPLVGATIKVKRTSLGTSTDAEGRFMLEVNPGDILMVTYTGFTPQEIKIGKAHNLTIRMALVDSRLDEIQIVAYGQSSKRYNVGNVAVVKAEDIAKAPVANVLSALQGRVPGLYIQQNSGFVGSNFTVTVQGQNSIGNGNNPLYIVDGVPWVSDLLGEGAGVLGHSGVNSNWNVSGTPLTYLNPADIESITVLKDADATAIYGARAANGAILINTKRGKPGSGAFELNVRHGKNLIMMTSKTLTPSQYLEMRREAKKNDGTPIYNTDYDLNGFWDTTRYSNWQKILLGGHGDYTEVSGTLTGGNASVRYNIGLTYNHSRPIIPGNYGDRRGTLHSTLNTASANQRFKTDISTTLMYDVNRLPGGDQSGQATFFSPVAPPPYDADGKVNFMPTATGSSSFFNPLRNYAEQVTNTGRRVSVSSRLSYQVFTGLEIATRLGYDYLNTYGVRLSPIEVLPPEYRPFAERGSSFQTGTYEVYNIEPQLNFNRAIGVGKLEVTAGYTFQSNTSRFGGVNGGGYTTDAAMRDISQAKTIGLASSFVNRYRVNGGFGRVSYIHAKRYILNFTGRRDGSSRFGPANRFHNFGAIGAGWILTEESFMRPLAKVLSFGKVNVSYGTAGNDQIGEYQYMSIYYPYNMTRLYQNGTAIVPSGLANPDLKWEQIDKLNFGMQLGFLKDRFMLELNYYRNRSGQQLQTTPLAATTGFGGVAENRAASVQNTGLEIVLNTTNISTKSFSWSSHFTLSVNRNKLLRYDGIETTVYASLLTVGKSLSTSRTYHYLGVDPQTGLYSFMGADGKPTSRPQYETDRIVSIDRAPRFFGGIDNTLTYKSLSLAFFISFTRKNGDNWQYGTLMPGSSKWNQPATVMDRWQKPGDIKPVQRFSVDNLDADYAFGSMLGSDASIRDASYARLRNVTISYSLPAVWARKAHVRDVQFYGNIQNLFTWTYYPLGDPESGTLDAMPQLKTVTVGLKLAL